jgi:hypothetical protein
MKSFAEYITENAVVKMRRKAEDASEKADNSDRPEHHRVAAAAYKALAKEVRLLGDGAESDAKKHDEQAKYHEDRAKKLDDAI